MIRRKRLAFKVSFRQLDRSPHIHSFTGLAGLRSGLAMCADASSRRILLSQLSFLAVPLVTHLRRPVPVSTVKIEFFLAATPKLAFILFPQSDQTLPVQSVQPARANRQRLWQELWQAIMTRVGGAIWELFGLDTRQYAWKLCELCGRLFYPKDRRSVCCSTEHQSLWSKRVWARKHRADTRYNIDIATTAKQRSGEMQGRKKGLKARLDIFVGG